MIDNVPHTTLILVGFYLSENNRFYPDWFFHTFLTKIIGLKFIPNQSELFRCLYLSQYKTFRSNPKNNHKSIRLIPIQSEPSFQFESIQARIDSDWKLSLDWFEMIRIGSDTDIGMNRNSSEWLGMNFYPKLLPGKWI